MFDNMAGPWRRHARMHEQRSPQDPNEFTQRITAPGSQATGGIVFETDAGSAFTTITTQTRIIPITGVATTIISTAYDVTLITDSAQYASITSSEAARSKETASTSKASSSASSTAAASSEKSSGSNIGTLIPAIVVPIAVVLIVSFGLFWWFLRRRAQKQAKKELEFIMAKKKTSEKPLKRENSSRSSGSSSTRELVPLSKLEKEGITTTTKEVRFEKRGASEQKAPALQPPKYSPGTVGVARPMTPPEKSMKNPDGTPKKSVPNFSAPRPRTGQGHRQTDSHDSKQSRSRSHSASNANSPRSQHNGRTGPPLPSGPQSTLRPPPGPINPGGKRAGAPDSLNPPTPTGAFNGSSPISQYSPIIKDTPNLAAVATTNAAARSNNIPAAINTSNHKSSGSRGLDSPVDENALTKENMRIARLANSSRLGFGPSSPVEKDDHSPRLPPPATRDDHLPSPSYPFFSPTAPSSTYSSPAIGSNSPALIGTAISNSGLDLDFSQTDYRSASTSNLQHGGTLSAIEEASTYSGSKNASSTHLGRQLSIISRLSSDDGYVDMEAPASPKSDVSSLDERDKWEMAIDQQQARSGSAAGSTHNGNAAGPGMLRLGTSHIGSSNLNVGTTADDQALSPVTATSSHSPITSNPVGIRDRDSEGPFVLSRY